MPKKLTLKLGHNDLLLINQRASCMLFITQSPKIWATKNKNAPHVIKSKKKSRRLQAKTRRNAGAHQKGKPSEIGEGVINNIHDAR